LFGTRRNFGLNPRAGSTAAGDCIIEDFVPVSGRRKVKSARPAVKKL
jgi:hypothetical protein